MTRVAILSAAVLLAACGLAVEAGKGPQNAVGQMVTHVDGLQEAALEAVGEDAAKAEAAIGQLRAAGYAGLDAVLAAAPMAATAIKAGPGLPSPEVLRWKAAVDRVAMQKDASVSRLFWFTDLEEAKAEAQRSGKPILSLRMLGKLNEDLSCANSRFFRTTLYANGEIAGYLREHFILHWESVRPVPVVTIDMGDGRKLVRTITGNSIHYVLDAKGRVVDGLPGLYGPAAFLKGLKVAEGEALAVGGMEDMGFVAALREYEGRRVEEILGAWRADLAKAGATAVLMPVDVSVHQAVVVVNPPAAAAGKVAIGKGRLEIPILAKTGMGTAADDASLEMATDEAMWEKIAALHAEDARLDGKAKELMRAKVPADVAGRLTVSKAFVENPMVRMTRSFERSMAMDTVKNEYRLHVRICQWLGAGAQPVQLRQLNERVYAELFLTPSSDPWLGLAPADAFSAIDGGGECQTAKR